jgi:hypothetical protein
MNITSKNRGSQRLAGGSVLAVGLMKADKFPVPLSDGSCAEVLFYRMGSEITAPSGRNTNFEHVAMTRWSTDFMRVNFKFTNKFPFKIEYTWHEESHDSVDQGSLKSGESVSISSFLGHIFSANRFKLRLNDKMRDAPKDLIDFMTVNGDDYEFHPSNRMESCEVSHITEGGEFVDAEHLTCDNMEMRFVEFSNQVWHVKRLGLNYVQPKLVPPVTDAGFEKRKLPATTYAWLREWYTRQRELEEIDENAVGPCMNQHVAPTGITHITPELKTRLSSEMQEILEGWYEKGALTMTSIYGVRRYINNSVLRMHVDTVNTHVVSAIINVDQGDMDRDWPLLILDHDGNEHNVIMEPGDMVLYESAKLLHGRPETMKGGHYDNIFIHYMPVSGWDYGWI